MCLDCACGKPGDAHGETGHILGADLKRAAQLNGISIQQAASNILSTVKAKMAEPAKPLSEMSLAELRAHADAGS